MSGSATILRAMADAHRYKDAELELCEWDARPFCCEFCEVNHGIRVVPGEKFPSGDIEPPSHKGCTCCLLPVIPGFDE